MVGAIKNLVGLFKRRFPIHHLIFNTAIALPSREMFESCQLRYCQTETPVQTEEEDQNRRPDESEDEACNFWSLLVKDAEK
jgi:hypothetical protein